MRDHGAAVAASLFVLCIHWRTTPFVHRANLFQTAVRLHFHNRPCGACVARPDRCINRTWRPRSFIGSARLRESAGLRGGNRIVIQALSRSVWNRLVQASLWRERALQRMTFFLWKKS